MKAVSIISGLAFAGQAYAHGYVWRVEADNTAYPGWDIYVDTTIKPVPKRIAYGGADANPITAVNISSIACNKGLSPVPGAIAEARAGSNVTFHWSPWLHSHKGPITAWLAPYDGDVAKVNVNQLDFFKFAEETHVNGTWWNNRFIDQQNNSWTVPLPSDIKPGTYILRHEIIALHFDSRTNPGLEFAGVGAQFYPACFNFKVTGDGTVTPPGMKFPGAYDPKDAGLHYDVNLPNNTTPYSSLGPAVYRSSRSVSLVPRPQVIVSPTGNGNASDTAYYVKQMAALKSQGQTTSYFDSIGG